MSDAPSQSPDAPDAHAQGLVEPEGVNAASAQPERESGDRDLRSGGRPEAADQADGVASRAEIVGPPDQGDTGPGQELAAGEG